MDACDNLPKEKVMVDFKYFIQSAIDNKISWNTLSCFWTELPTTLVKSQEVIKILVQELEKWVSKVESAITLTQTQAVFDDDSKVFKDDLVNQEDSEIPCSDDGNISGGEYNKIASEQFEDQTQEPTGLESDVKVSNNVAKENEDLRCTFCNKTYSFKTNLERHKRIHTPSEHHICNTCGKTFYRSDGLKDHLRIHTGKKPFECKTCNKFFKMSNTLRKHERIHTGERPFQCKTCGKCFKTQHHLKRHENIHTKTQ